MISLSSNRGSSLPFSLRAMALGFLCLGLAASAREKIEHSTLSSHLTVLEQSLSGVTFQITLPSGRGNITERHQAIVAIPPGDTPKHRVLEASCSVWDREGNLISRETIAASKLPGALSEWVRIERAISMQPLGLVRGIRLAALQVLPYHISLKDSADQVQLERLVFRLEFPQPGLAAEPEPIFQRPFPSGFHDLFLQIVANAKTLPAGQAPDDRKDLYPPPLPYQLENSLKLCSDQEGLHFLPASELTALSKDPITPDRIALFHRRQSVSFATVQGKNGQFLPRSDSSKPLAEEDGLLFYVPRSDSPYDPESVLFLTLSGSDHRRGAASAAPLSAHTVPASTEAFRLSVEEDLQIWDKKGLIKDKTQADYWIWQEVGENQPFEQNLALPGPLSANNDSSRMLVRLIVLPDRAPVSFNMQGYRITLNGVAFSGPDLASLCRRLDAFRSVVEFALPLGMFDAQNPRLEVRIETALAISGRNRQEFALDRLEFAYDRLLQLESRGIRFKPCASEREWAILCPRELKNEKWFAAGRTASGLLTFLPSEKTTDALRVSAASGNDHVEEVFVLPSALALPEPRLERSFPNRLFQPSSRADLIVVSHPLFLEALGPLLELRREQGYAVRLVTTSDVYRDFGDGSLSPEAIKDYLRFAYRQGGPARPSYALLVGDARWDYWGRYGLGIPNLLPSYHTDPAYCSDNWYACVNDEDPLPDYFISRLSVADVTAARTVIAKLVDYETGPPSGPWRNRILFLADNDERIFEDESERQIREKIPDAYRTILLRVRDYPLKDDFGAPEASRIEKKLKHSEACSQALMEQLEEGVLLWEYYGHGSPNVFAAERLFFAGDTPYSFVKRMNNRARLPMVVALTCDTIQFDYAGEVGPKWALCIGEELLSWPDGGAIAVYGATGRGYTNHHVKLNNGFHDALFLHGFRTTGELMTVSKLLTYAEDRMDEPVNMFGLLGGVLTPLALPGEGISVKADDSDLAAGKGGPLDVQTVLSEPLERQLRSMTAQISVQDANCRLLSETQKDAPKPKDLEASLTLPADAAGGRGRINVLLFSKEDKQSAVYAGGAGFAIPAEPRPPVGPEGALPDLHIPEGGIRLSPDTPLTGETIFMDVNIANRGRAPAFGVSASAYSGPPEQDGTPLPDLQNYIPPSLPWIRPGETRSLRLRWDPVQNHGWHTLYIVADPENRVAESHEDNNSATASIYVRKKMDFALMQEDFSLAPLGRRKGYELAAAVRNLGEVQTEPSRILVRIFDREGAEHPSETSWIEMPNPIAPYRYNPQTGTWGGGRARFKIPLPDSTIRFELEVDPEETLYEETHTNNRLGFRVDELLKKRSSRD